VSEGRLARLGRYDLLEPLGAGGMAEVWRAATNGAAGFNKEVALKLIRSGAADDERFLSMFADEARISARLSHPNVVATLDFGCISGRYFIALELIDGMALSTLLRAMYGDRRYLDRTLAIYIVAETAAGLHYAHHATDQHGEPLCLVHRDVNPANIMVSAHGEVKLADFGIAKATGRSTHTEAGALKGKFSYMSPEQAWGRALDARSDIYTLTLVLQELVTARRALDGDNDIAVLEHARKGEVAPLGDGVPRALATVIRRGLAFAPESRFESAAELREALLPMLEPGRQLGAELAALVAEAKPSSTLPRIATPQIARGAGATILTDSGETPGHASNTSPDEAPPRRRGPGAIGIGLGAALLASAGAVAWRATHQPNAQVVRAQPAVAPSPPAPSPAPAAAPPPRATLIVTEVPEPAAAPAAPAKKRPREPAHEPTPRSAAGEHATLRISVQPWATVWLDGRELGMTPLRPLDVASGTHTITMKHPELGARTMHVTLHPGEHKLVERDLRKE
jgi:serine/threonine-protein kinase